MPYLFAVTPQIPSPTPKPWEMTHLLSVSTDLPILDILYKQNPSYNVWPLVSGFFHLASCTHGASTLQPVSVLHAFLWRDDVLPCDYPMFLFISQLIVMWVVPYILFNASGPSSVSEIAFKFPTTFIILITAPNDFLVCL